MKNSIINGVYSYLVCIELCKQKHVYLAQCSCQNAAYSLYDRSQRVCQTQTELQCTKTASGKLSVDYINGVCAGICPLECDSYSYSATLSSADYPSMYYTNYVKKESVLNSKFSKLKLFVFFLISFDYHS